MVKGLIPKWLKQKEKNDPVNNLHTMEIIPKNSNDRYPVYPKARPSDYTTRSGWFRYGEFVEHPDVNPGLLYPFFRYLRDHIPDVSNGVWAWVRLCSTPQHVTFTGGSEDQRSNAEVLVKILDSRIYEFDHMKRQGMDALVNSFFLSVFTYGAFSGEVVLKNDRTGIDKFYLIDPATIRFKRYKTSRRLIPYQILSNGDIIRLNESSFFYYALDSDNENPYGRSPLLSLPFVIRIQQQLINDMQKAQHNAGWPTLHLSYSPPERMPGESLTTYQERIKNNFETIRNGLKNKEADSNFLTYDNIEIKYIGPSGHTIKWQETQQAIGEQVVSALHLAPFMLGRNWGTTESWGAAQYDLLINNAVSVQRGAKRMCEWLRNLELSLAGIPVSSTHHFEPHNDWRAKEKAETFSTRAKAYIELLQAGLVTPEIIQRELDLN